ncbi:pectinesterase family protein [Luteimonas sp. FCS-9]|uniref:pectinesterase family protein n=1 Tax=Luteimonas sp. FCS-9 TaxID=1547516 RepID=UPI00069BA4FB|nr:pectinesterase family protein [Luteimonas sp. FCS-9]
MAVAALLACATAGAGERVFVVGDGGFGDVQAAVDAAVAAAGPATIRIGAGTWRGVVDVPPGAPPLRMVGAGATRTRLVQGHFAARIDPATGQPFGTYGSATMFVRADDFSAEALTIANDAGPVGQAVALVVDGTRAAFRDVHLLGHQDTLYLRTGGALAYFGDCRIEGTVDYVFGGATALFERCTLHSVGDGYVTAASTPAGAAHGFVFRDCRLTAAPGVRRVHLGRPWRADAAVLFAGCTLEAPVPAEGWHDWGRPERRATARFSEIGNDGPGAAIAGRVSWRRPVDRVPDAAEVLAGWSPFE